MKLSLPFFLLMMSMMSCGPTSAISQRPIVVIKCLSLFKKIEVIQKERDEETAKMGKITTLFLEKIISKQEHRHQRIKWLIKENTLRTQVNDLFEFGTTLGCL